jgi:predicted outer membrane repeat protein
VIQPTKGGGRGRATATIERPVNHSYTVLWRRSPVKNCVLLTLFAASVLVGALPAAAETFNVPDPYATIEAGVNAASNGDTVLVAPGTYTGAGNRSVLIDSLNIVLMSEAGAAATLIDCEGAGEAIIVYNECDSTCVVRGFTIANGNASLGGGLRVNHSSATIEDCVFYGNSAGNGGGLYFGYATSPGTVRNCEFYGNTARFRGGAIACDHIEGAEGVPPVIRDCVIYDNEESTESTYGGGGIYCAYSSATIVGCTVVGNSGEPGRGAIYGSSCYPVVTRTISAFNLTGPGIYNVDADHCIIYGNVDEAPQSIEGRENLDVNPLFCDVGSWDLTVCDDSPCIATDPENPWGERIGALGVGCGSCDTVIEETSWGAIKSLFRNE